MKKIIFWLLLFCVTVTICIGAESQKELFITIASETKNFKAVWDYGCPAGMEIHFNLYMKDEQWQLIKEMDLYCTQEDQETKHFEELFECEIPDLGKDYIFGLSAVNDEGVESDIVESVVHVPLPPPEIPQNFKVFLDDGGGSK